MSPPNKFKIVVFLNRCTNLTISKHRLQTHHILHCYIAIANFQWDWTSYSKTAEILSGRARQLRTRDENIAVESAQAEIQIMIIIKSWLCVLGVFLSKFLNNVTTEVFLKKKSSPSLSATYSFRLTCPLNHTALNERNVEHSIPELNQCSPAGKIFVIWQHLLTLQIEPYCQQIS